MSRPGKALAEAIKNAGDAELILEVGVDDTWERYAFFEGRAFGLAFRAAEIAYDMGYKQGRVSAAREFMRAAVNGLYGPRAWASR